MLKGLWKKKKALAFMLVMVMVFTLLPTDFNWADSVSNLEPSATEELTTAEEVVDTVEEEVAAVYDTSAEKTEATSEEQLITTLETQQFDTAVDEDSNSTENNDLVVPGTLEEENNLIGASEVMLSTGNFELTNLELSASYTDENGQNQNVEMTTTEGVTLPDDATISLSFDYIMYDGDKVNVGQEYIYPIPEGIRIDVNETLDLITSEGSSIGTVKIDKENQRLVFVFNSNVEQQVSIPFFVRFAGGLSCDAEEEAEQVDLQFATANGHFDYHITVEDSYQDTTPEEPGDLGMTKSANKVYIDGKPYIEWTLSLNLNGRESLDAEITDALPAGLTYVSVGGYPKITDTKDGNATVTATESNGVVTLNVSNVTTYYRANVKFLTSYDNTIFGDNVITNSTQASVPNTASILEDGSTIPATGSGTAIVTPSVLSKSGSQSGGVITWTVQINKDQLDCGGATYTDSFGEGLVWNTADGSYDASCISVSPAGSGVITASATGFSFVVNEGNKNDVITITYETKIDDFTKPNYKNDAELTEPGIYDVHTYGTVDGFNLINKSSGQYNEVTKEITWTITVNGEKADSVFDGADTVQITDVFNPNAKQNMMKLKSMKITGASGASTLADFAGCEADENGVIIVPADKLKGTALTITVVTAILPTANENYVPGGSWDTITPWADGDYVNVRNEANLQWGSNNIPVSNNTGFQYKTPDLLSKSGEPEKYNDGSLKHNGIVNWTIVSSTYQQDMSVDTITLTDIVPEGMKYVAGSMYINKRWTNDKVSVTPAYDEATRTLTITLDKNDPQIAECLDYIYNFEIHYQTRVSDQDMAGENVSYTNNAEFEVTYDGFDAIVDGDSATVTGELGGELGKEAFYQSGKDFVDWEVKINEGHFDMSGILNPVIRDTLASYLQYEQNSAQLIRVDEDGNESPVGASEFVVNVINNELVVSLPNIGTDTIIFKFRTRFTCTAQQAASLSFSNEIAFQGSGYSESVSSNQVQNVSFSSSSAGAYHENELRVFKIRKKDNPDEDPVFLPGAVFHLLDSKGTFIAKGVTDANGVVVFKGVKLKKDGYSYQLVEVTAPDGYLVNSDIEPIEIESFKTAADGTRYFEIEVEDEPIEETTEFSIRKVSLDGSKKLSGAEFSVYDDMPFDEDSFVNSKETGSNGEVTFKVSYSDTEQTTYYLVETSVPDGYLSISSDLYYEVVIDTDGSVASITEMPSGTVLDASDVCEIKNEQAKGTFKLYKVDKDDNAVYLPGAKFTLYLDKQCSDDVATVTTDADGLALFEDLEIGRTYYYKEVVAPDGYLIDPTVYSIKIDDATKHDADGKVHQNITVTATVEDKVALGSIRVVKTDNSTPAKLLEGAEFTLYKLPDTVNPFIKPGTVDTPYVVTTGSNGVAEFKDLPFGKYLVKETDVPTGYVVSAAGDSTNVTVDSVEQVTVPVVNDVIRFNLKIKKVDDSTPAENLAGAQFEVRNSAHVLVDRGETDANGELVFTNLPYDTYTVKEVKGIPGYTLDTTSQTLNANLILNGGTNVLTFVNHKQDGGIRFKKVDKENNLILLEDAEFTLYNASGDVVDIQTTGTNGVIEFTGLPYGDYTIKETKAPNKYQLNTETWQVSIADDVVVEVLVALSDSSDVNGLIEDEKIPSGNNYMHFKLLKANAKGEKLQGAKFELTKNFPSGGDYGTNDTNGAPVSYTAYSDENGVVEFRNVYIEYDPDQTTYTLKETEAPYGYKITQEVIFENCPKADLIGDGTDGIVLSTADPIEDTVPIPDVTSEFVDADNLYTDATGDALINEQLLGKIVITKKASGTVNTVLGGAEFTLYRFDVPTNKYVVFTQDGLENPAVTPDETADGKIKGVVVFDNLPLGKYRVVETKAPAGYVLNPANQKDFEITAENYNNMAAFSATMSDALISVTVNKYAINGSTQLTGAVLGLYKTEDTAYENPIETWTTTSQAHKIGALNLVAGQIYVIHEIKAPKGYSIAPVDVKFQVNANGTVTYVGAASEYGAANGTSVTLYDKALSLAVSKMGIDTENSMNDGPLSGASISIIDNETGNAVYTFTTSTSVQDIPGSVLSVPANADEYHYYTVHENSAPGGYAVAEDIQIAIDCNGQVYKADEDGTIIDSLGADNTVVMEDEKYVDFYFAKRDKKTGDALSGATFGIYKEEDWDGDRTNTNFATDLSTGDTLKWKSTKAAKRVSLDLGIYYFVELKAPNGYELEDPIKFQIIDGTPKKIKVLQDSGNSNLSANQLMLTSRDSSLVIKFVKWASDIDGNFTPLTGGSFSIHKSNASKEIGVQIGASFAATGSAIELPNTLFNLENYYVVVEDEAPDGYSIAEPMFFYINANGEMEEVDGNHTLIDDNMLIFIDGEKNFAFKKVDASTGKNVKGATMTITSDEDTDFETITWVTDGSVKYVPMNKFKQDKTYILTEEIAADGYAYASSKEFKYVLGTGGAADSIYVDGTLVDTMTIVMKDEPIKISVDKFILNTTTHLEGAKLEITDDAGVVIDSFVTTEGTHIVDARKIKASTTPAEYVYTLSEVEAPDMYALAQPIDFYVDETGDVYLVDGDEAVANNRLEMYDEYLGILFTKQDVAGNELPGATLSITSEEDQDFEGFTWVTTDVPLNISRDFFVTDMTYTLSEIEAPNGYTCAEPVNFKVDDLGDVYIEGTLNPEKTVLMVDDTIVLNLAKKDKNTHKMLAGAKFGVFDAKTGDQVATVTSEGDITSIDTSKLKVSSEEIIFYYLRELEAPKGYKLAKDIYFYYDATGKLMVRYYGTDEYVESADNTITVLDEPETTIIITTETTTTNKKTGDAAPIRAVAAMFLLSMGGMVVLGRRKRRQ